MEQKQQLKDVFIYAELNTSACNRIDNRDTVYGLRIWIETKTETDVIMFTTLSIVTDDIRIYEESNYYQISTGWTTFCVDDIISDNVNYE